MWLTDDSGDDTRQKAIDKGKKGGKLSWHELDLVGGAKDQNVPGADEALRNAHPSSRDDYKGSY